jgi:alpha 1,3-glucosidase
MLVHWILFIMSVAAVKHSDFKKCDQSGFCVRQRAYADWMDDTKTSVYHLVPNSLIFNPATSTFKADMVHQPHQTIFSLTMDFLDIKAVRIRLSEKNGRPRYDGPQQFSLNPSLTGLANVKIQQTDKKAIIDLDATNRLVIDFQPFVVHLLMDKTPIFSFNGRQYLNYETSRKLEWKASETVDNSTTKSDHEKKMDELMAKLHKDMQVETFNGHTDTKPNGPQSIGLDVSFHGFEHAFGLAEHATSFDLKDTR